MEYKYLAVNRNGSIKKGYEYAENNLELLRLLKRKELLCIKYSKVNKIFSRRSINIVSYKDIAMFCKYMCIALETKLSFIEGLELIISRINNKPIRKSLKIIKEDMGKGESLYRAMMKHRNIYPNNLINMIKIGEDSGNLKNIFNNMESYYLQKSRLRKKFFTSFIYPAFVLIVGISIQIIFMTTILPKFITQFNIDLTQLPSITKFYLNTSEYISVNKFKSLVQIFIIVALVLMVKTNKKLRENIARFKFKIPLLRKILIKKIRQEFSSSMSILLNSGINLVESYDITTSTISNKYIKKILYEGLNKLITGETLSNSLKSTEIFEKFFIEVVAIGEEGGRLNESFNTLKDILTEDMESFLVKVTEITQPTIIVIVGILITTMIVAMLIPMLNMIEFMAL